MATYRLDNLVSVAALLQYAAALLATARTRSAALAAIPDVEADLRALEEATARLEEADLEWSRRSRGWEVALGRRDRAFGLAMEAYGLTRSWLPVLILREPDPSALRRILSRCRAPGALKAGSAPAALESLASGVEDYPRAFARVGAGAADVALLRARRDALVAAAAAVSRADRERGAASERRDVARSALVDAARLVEAYLVRRGGPEGRVVARALRVHNLPRRSRRAEEEGPAGSGG